MTIPRQTTPNVGASVADPTKDPVRRILNFHSERDVENTAAKAALPVATRPMDVETPSRQRRLFEETPPVSAESQPPDLDTFTLDARDPALVLGAGPAGCLMALELSRLGIPVEVFEYRTAQYFYPSVIGSVPSDQRRKADDAYGQQRPFGRSINLALSARGLRALARVGLAERVHSIGVPMRGRMIHDTRGRLHFQAYGGRPEEYLLSVSRMELNQMLVDACLLDERGLITMHFGKKCSEVDLERSVLTFEDVPESSRLGHWIDATTIDSEYAPPSSRLLQRKRRALQRAAHVHAPAGTDTKALETPPRSADADLTWDESIDRAREQGSVLSTPPSVVSTRHVTASFIVGADGAYSKVRRAMQRLPPFDYEQEYLPTAYKELTIPPRRQATATDAHANYLLAPNALHIWPRHRFMLIALPNRDGSFTATLFMNWLAEASAPDAPSFAEIVTPTQVQRFFETHFPDLYALVPSLVTEYQRNPVAPLFTVRCAPFHYRGRAVLVGDAAHVMVPFYGQGCNAALEDCRILAELLSQEMRQTLLRAPSREGRPRLRLPSSGVVVDFEDAVEDNDIDVAKSMLTGAADEYQPTEASSAEDIETLNLERVFQAYTAERKPNADAITNLALENYREMASKTSSRLFRWKREIQNRLHAFMPSYFMSLYHMISFSHIPYAESVRRAQRQDRLFTAMFRTLGVSCIGLAGYAFWCARHSLRKASIR